MFLAALCFQAAYVSIHFPAAGFLIFGYAFFLVRLTNQSTVRQAFYIGLATGFLCYAPQLFFFWHIFNLAAVVLWLILAAWLGLFAAICCGCLRGGLPDKIMWLIPIVWTGLEYFRSELYYLKFSWMNVGYALPPGLNVIGMYGLGFLAFGLAAALNFSKGRPLYRHCAIMIVLGLAFAYLKLPATPLDAAKSAPENPLRIVGVQMEFPNEKLVTKALTAALAKNPGAQIFVLSECTLDGGVSDSIKNWCRERARYLIVGGKDFVTNDIYFNTAFVVDPNGDVVFKQAKSVPVQFFQDGLPARKQAVWESPWGRIGVCICYDLSYTRVTDSLVSQGAQLLIVPTMDVSEWGRHQHELHSRVAPVRAAEYDIPIFRVASSGISQAVQANGYVTAQTHVGGIDEVLSAELTLAKHPRMPWDRVLAPLCLGFTIVILVLRLLVTVKTIIAGRRARALAQPKT
jgi:apolipoprotein N-acyltransferase